MTSRFYWWTRKQVWRLLILHQLMSIYSYPCNKQRISFRGPHTIFFPKQALFHTALFSSKIPQFSSLLWKVGHVEWSRWRYHPSWFLSGVFEEMRKKKNVHQGWETAFHLFILTSRNPDSRWTICSNLLCHCGRWLFVCLTSILPFLCTHRGTEQCSRWNRLPRHLCH